MIQIFTPAILLVSYIILLLNQIVANTLANSAGETINKLLPTSMQCDPKGIKKIRIFIY